MLDAHQLNIFLVASETLNFTQAAQRLHMSQPSVSQHIRSLEKHFGTKLFLRQGRTIRLSHAGETLLPFAREFVQQSRTIDEVMASLQGVIQGQIHLCHPPEIGAFPLSKSLFSFHDAFPDIRITLQLASDPTPIELLLDGACHFALTSDEDQLSDLLAYHHLGTENIGLLVPSNHPWAEKGRIGLGDLMRSPIILPRAGSPLYRLLNHAISTGGFELDALRSPLQMDCLEGMTHAVAQGLGIGFGPQTSAALDRKITFIDLQDLKIQQKKFLVRDKKGTLTAARQALWDHLTTSVTD